MRHVTNSTSKEYSQTCFTSKANQELKICTTISREHLLNVLKSSDLELMNFFHFPASATIFSLEIMKPNHHFFSCLAMNQQKAD